MTTADTAQWRMTFEGMGEVIEEMISGGRSDEAIDIAEAYLIGFSVSAMVAPEGFSDEDRLAVAGWHSNLMRGIYGNESLPRTIRERAQAHITGRRGTT